MVNLNKSKKIIIFSAAVATILLNGAYAASAKPVMTPSNIRVDNDDKQEIRELVEAFGKKLQNVSLLAPEDIVVKSILENYGGLVTPALLQKWLENPRSAPGRVVSSPWPDRINILKMERIDKKHYRVYGEVIEITSVELENGGVAAKRPIALEVQEVNGRWLINDVTIGDYE